MNPSSRFGPRLNAIYDIIAQQQNPYICIWDCCCDHGYLGIKILHDNLCEKLIFVDQLAHIMQQLSAKLASFGSAQYELITADAGELTFDLQQRHLVILAGVGGETTVEIVSSIRSNHPDVQIDYIFCPSSRQNALREYLVAEKLGLISENLVCENRRYYEILYVQGKKLSGEVPGVPLHCNMWDEANPDHQRYLNKINAPRGSKKPLRKKIGKNFR